VNLSDTTAVSSPSKARFPFFNISYPSEARTSQYRKKIRSHVTKQQHRRGKASTSARSFQPDADVEPLPHQTHAATMPSRPPMFPELSEDSPQSRYKGSDVPFTLGETHAVQLSPTAGSKALRLCPTPTVRSRDPLALAVLSTNTSLCSYSNFIQHQGNHRAFTTLRSAGESYCLCPPRLIRISMVATLRQGLANDSTL
jgi:hypothetical protein